MGNASSRDSDLLTVLLGELQQHLQRRSRELKEEVRNYPTPIARCDEQLPKLIEQRNEVVRRSQAIDAVAPPLHDNSNLRDSLWRFLNETEADADDETEVALRSRLKEALRT